MDIHSWQPWHSVIHKQHSRSSETEASVLDNTPNLKNYRVLVILKYLYRKLGWKLPTDDRYIKSISAPSLQGQAIITLKVSIFISGLLSQQDQHIKPQDQVFVIFIRSISGKQSILKCWKTFALCIFCTQIPHSKVCKHY